MMACASASVSPAPKNAGDEPMPPKLPQPRMTARNLDPAAPEGTVFHAAMLRGELAVLHVVALAIVLAVVRRVELPVLCVLQQGQRIAGEARGSLPVAVGCQDSGVLPENTRAFSRIVKAAGYGLSILRPGERLAAKPRQLPRGPLA